MALTNKQKLAVEKLFRQTDSETAASLGVSLETLQRWKRQPAFQAAIAAKTKEIRSAAARMLSMGLLAAAQKLKSLIEAGGPNDRSDPKILLDTLKASGLFEEAASEDQAGDSIEQAIAEALKTASNETTD